MIARVSTVLLALCWAWATPADAQTTSARPKMLIHGNYCGPGDNAPLAPIDALDAACARHDACTPEDALPTKDCNLRLQVEANAISRDPRQPQDLRTMAALVSAAASMMLAKLDEPIERTDVGEPAAGGRWASLRAPAASDRIEE